MVLQLSSPISTNQGLQKTATLPSMGVQAAHGPARPCVLVTTQPCPYLFLFGVQLETLR